MERECSYISGRRYIKYNDNAAKNPAVSALQDLLFYQIVGLAFFVRKVFAYKNYDIEINNLLTGLLYFTNKNINFSISAMKNAIFDAYKLRNKMESLYQLLPDKNKKKYSVPAQFKPGETLAQMVSQANIINIQKTLKNSDFNIIALKEIIRLSVSSSVNYLKRIISHDKLPQSIYSCLYDILEFLGSEKASLSDCKKYVLKAGELHTQTLERVITSFEKTYGLIEKKKVTTSYKKGSAILVAGEDFSFLQNLLKETENKDINIYTYGILNYAHAFPEINKFKNLAGIYIGRYNNFTSDIEHFPGVVVLTAGNLSELRELFRGRIFSTEDISMLGICKINKNDLKPLINAAYDAPGFTEDKENCYIELGFGIKELENLSDELYLSLSQHEIDNINIFLSCNEDIFDRIMPRKNNDAVILLDSVYPKLNDAKNTQKVFNLGEFVNLYSLIRLLYSVSGKLKYDIENLPSRYFVNLKSPNSVAALLMLLSVNIKNIMINSELPNYLSESLLKNFPVNLRKIGDNEKLIKKSNKYL